MQNRFKSDCAIFFRLPTALVDEIDAAAYDLRTKRTEFIRQAIFRALDTTRADFRRNARRTGLDNGLPPR